MAERYDVIIIGSGAGGGTLAHRLAPSGKKILILERGDWLPGEALNWNVDAVFADNRYVSPDTWMLPDGKSFQPQVHYFVGGGATKVFGAALYRLRKQDFGELTRSVGSKFRSSDMDPFRQIAMAHLSKTKGRGCESRSDKNPVRLSELWNHNYSSPLRRVVNNNPWSPDAYSLRIRYRTGPVPADDSHYSHGCAPVPKGRHRNRERISYASRGPPGDPDGLLR